MTGFRERFERALSGRGGRDGGKNKTRRRLTVVIRKSTDGTVIVEYAAVVPPSGFIALRIKNGAGKRSQ